MGLNEFLESLSLSDSDKKVVTELINEINDIDDLDEKMDFINESTFYFDMECDVSVSDEITDYIKETFV